ncbi:succinate--CoA ligase subunit alpha [Bordetella sp. BOR01]|uniref:succinate--CoA ligase subunit alpha n=1 Tax=Bordetella sp. BOR01 TaxID=2854779 RepID=UPI001C497153|nr:succinate--CoA ligase subunit alpha [Bordetella sp. BOR01]MBV7484820.1 succinate--CoA ligase subunit alpha [Bordetella sp. BOR01]
MPEFKFDLDILTPALPVLVQGVTGRMGRLHTKLMLQYGTHIAGGVSAPGSERRDVPVPVFFNCKDAVAATGATTSLVMTPAMQTKAAFEEAISAGLRTVITIAEGIPVHDALIMRTLASEAGVFWIGPSTPGLAVPGKMKIGFLPDVSLSAGEIGVMSKSGTLAYEICHRLTQQGIGQSAWIGVGGDPVKGLRFADLAESFATHTATKAVLLIGEIGGTEEEEFADRWRGLGSPKPVYALIAGAQAKEGVTMGHAGALVLGERGSLESKRAALQDCGVHVFQSMRNLVAQISADRAQRAQ